MKTRLIVLFSILVPLVVAGFWVSSPSFGKASLVDTFECRKLNDGKLSDLKLKLITHCNLDKPFSFGSSDYAMGNAYTMCCHKKAVAK